MRPLVLCYHAVSDGWPHLLAVPPAALEEQLEALLRRGYRAVRAQEVLAGRGRLLHVTFDDAFASVGNALPLLERLAVPATVFACPAFAGDGRPLDLPELADEVASRPHELATMNWDDLRALAGEGVEVGAHSVSHRHLCELADEELARELRDSRRRIEDELGRPCLLLAYPYGEHDDRVRAAARAAGFEAAFGLQPRDYSWSDAFRLPRVGIWRGEGSAVVAFKTSPLGRSRPVTALRRARDRLAQ